MKRLWAFRDRILDGATLVAVFCAVVLTVSVVRRHAAAGPSGSTVPGDSTVLSSAEWRSLMSGGHRTGASHARLTIVEFGDFECPVCGTFERTLHQLLRAYPTEVAIVFHHWPLAYHRLAYPAARAAECAGQQGRFQPYHDLLYARQDSLGLISFAEFAGRAHVPDLPRFTRCNSSSALVPVIEADVAEALRLGGPGTPTVIVNGVRLGGVPDSAELASRLARAVSGDR